MMVRKGLRTAIRIEESHDTVEGFRFVIHVENLGRHVVASSLQDLLTYVEDTYSRADSTPKIKEKEST